MHANSSRRQVRRVLVITLILNLLVAFGKIVVGAMSGALAITADGFHSLMDGTSNIAGLVANYYASKPPDDDHPYGHRRFETLAGLLIGALLLLTAWEVTTSAIARLQNNTDLNLTPITFIVMTATLLINIGVSRYQIHQGKRLQSELLLADSANTSTDVFVTLSVIVSMGVIALVGWTWVDLISTLIVVGLIARAAWKIFQQTGAVLVDKAPYSPIQLEAIVDDAPGVERVIRARSRGSMDSAHIDIDVAVAPAMTAGQTQAISKTIRQRLASQLDGIAEIEVHFAVDDGKTDDYALIVRACADALGLTTHEVHLHTTKEQTVLDLHVEVPPEQTLQTAHEQVSQLEQSIYAHLTQIDEVITHIEPAPIPIPTLSGVSKTQDIQQRALRILNVHYPSVDWHDIQVYGENNMLTITLHAVLAPDISIALAHEIAENAERLLKNSLSELHRVTIHTEPEDHTVMLLESATP